MEERLALLIGDNESDGLQSMEEAECGDTHSASSMTTQLLNLT
jgi:hypothetical protein